MSDIRKLITDEYKVDPTTGVILSPGRFEGCMVYVPYFMDAALSGVADESCEDSDKFNVTAEDLAAFPELAGIKSVIVYADANGFAHCHLTREA